MINLKNFSLGNRQEFKDSIIIKILPLLIGNDYLIFKLVHLQVYLGTIYSNFYNFAVKFLKKINYFRLLCF